MAVDVFALYDARLGNRIEQQILQLKLIKKLRK